MLFPYLSDHFAIGTSSIGNLGSSIQIQARGKGTGFGSGLLLGAALAKCSETIKKVFGVLMIMTAIGLTYNFEVALQ